MLLLSRRSVIVVCIFITDAVISCFVDDVSVKCFLFVKIAPRFKAFSQLGAALN